MARRKTAKPLAKSAPKQAHPATREEEYAVIASTNHFSGPIPPPEIFRQYGDVIPDSPERILRVFEDDSRHIREIQFAALNAQKRDNQRRHWMAFTLILAGFLSAILLAWLNKDLLSAIALGSTLTGTIAGFFKGGKDSS